MNAPFLSAKASRVFIWVLLAHGLFFILIWTCFPDFSLKKILDIEVQLQPSQQRVVGGDSSSNTPSTSIVNKGPEKPSSEMGASAPTLNPSIPTASSNSQQKSRLVVPTNDIDLNAAYSDNPKPSYPPLAYRMRIEGRVVIEVEVLETGLVDGVRLFQTSGSELLDQSALDAVKKWRFRPAVKDGVIHRQWVKVPINFHLKKR